MQKVQKNDFGTPEWRLFFEKNGRVISPIHDITLFGDGDNIVRMVVEIPRGSQAKMEMATKEPFNPIKQDVKNGKLRFVQYPYPFNYGALPQTWEDPKFKDHNTKSFGDGDPIDACEIGSLKPKIGDVIEVKVLGIWGMIDDGQTDWKVVCINVKDPLAPQINSLLDVGEKLPGVLNYFHAFLRDYKIPSGAGPNQFAFDGELKNQEFAMKIIRETHEQWYNAVDGNVEAVEGAIWLPSEVSKEQSNGCSIQ